MGASVAGGVLGFWRSNNQLMAEQIVSELGHLHRDWVTDLLAGLLLHVALTNRLTLVIHLKNKKKTKKTD